MATQDRSLKIASEGGAQFTFSPDGTLRCGGVRVGTISPEDFDLLVRRVTSARRRRLPVQVVGIERKAQ